ncbi:MAG: ABC transporter permease subunit [Pseudomonadota bacterium]
MTTALDTSVTIRRKTRRVPGFSYGAVAPALLIVFLVAGLPLLYSLYLSFNTTNPITKRWVFVGLGNYIKLWENAEFWAALGRTAYFAVVSVAGTTILGTIIALILNERFPGRGLLRSVVLVPWAMAPVAIGVLWSFVFAGSFGLLNGLLNDLGLSFLTAAWLGDGFRALNLVALTHIWNQAPLTALMILSGLQSMPGNLHKAAILDGAGPVRRFFSITLPWLKSSYLFITIVATINALMTFDILLIMTRGGPGSATTVLSWLGYLQSFSFLRFGEGAAILYVLTFASLALAIVYFFIFRQRRGAERAADAGAATEMAWHAKRARRNPMVTLPAYQPRSLLPARITNVLAPALFALTAILIFLWSVLPVLALILMSLSPAVDLIRTPATVIPTTLTLDNFMSVLAAEGHTTSAQAKRVPLSLMNSFVVGVVVSVINVALGTLAGYAFARHAKERFFAGSLWALMLTRMIPGLTLVLPFFITFKTLGLLDTRMALIISYSSFLLPLSAWMMKATFESVPLSLDRAALVDGCSRFAMLIKVLLPVVRPGVIAAAIFCFLVSWNEFLFALILTSTPKAQTIPVVISGFLNQAQFYEYGPLFAASVLAIIPPVVVAFFFQRYLVQGALSGAVKG